MCRRAGVFWTRAPELWSGAIRYFNRPDWWAVWRPALVAHTGLVFELVHPAWELPVLTVHEALWGEGYTLKPWAKVLRFAGRPGRAAWATWLPIEARQARAIYASSKVWIQEGKRGYGRGQLLAFALVESLLGRAMGLTLRNDQRRVICSESVAFHLAALGGPWDLRTDARPAFDSLSPQDVLDGVANRCGATLGELLDGWRIVPGEREAPAGAERTVTE